MKNNEKFTPITKHEDLDLVDVEFQKAVRAAFDKGSYLATLTILDKEKEEGNLTHYAFRREFLTDDIIPNVDESLRTMRLVPPRKVETVKLPPLERKGKPLKIAIITHFNRCPDSYSPGRAVKAQIKMLKEFGHHTVFFVVEGSKLDVGCEMRPVVPQFRREKNIVNEEVKQKFIDVLREQLTDDFDLAITHDLYIDDCITYREAIKECGVPIKWVHWARSGVGNPIDFRMDNARYVYMNHADVGLFAQRIGVDPKNVRIAFNEKDPSLLFNWDKKTKEISDRMRLWDKDIIQTYPICTTRMDAKGINSVIATLAALKRLGNEVCLIVCNSNGRRRIEEVEAKMNRAKDCGLSENDILFTSMVPGLESEAPHVVVSQLFQISNLFIFPTIAEVCSNIMLEASMSRNLLVLNTDLPSLFDFVDEGSVLRHPFTSLQSVHYGERDEESIARLAKQIHGQIHSNKADKQMRHVWRVHNTKNLYKNMLEPILYE